MRDADGQSPHDDADDPAYWDAADDPGRDEWCELCGHTFPSRSLSLVDHEEGGSCYACRDCALDLAPVAPRRLEP